MEDPGLDIYAVLFPSCKQRRLPGHPRIQTSGTGAPPGAPAAVGVTFLPRWNVSPSPQRKSFLACSFLTSVIRFNVALQRDLPPRGGCPSQKTLLRVLICVA